MKTYQINKRQGKASGQIDHLKTAEKNTGAKGIGPIVVTQCNHTPTLKTGDITPLDKNLTSGEKQIRKPVNSVTQSFEEQNYNNTRRT
jgi:hypothetical protein